MRRITVSNCDFYFLLKSKSMRHYREEIKLNLLLDFIDAVERMQIMSVGG